MVFQGGFRVELVEADSKQPYKEHVKDGKSYAEVEPDVEYFVSIEKIVDLPKKRYVVECLVDNQDLGYVWYPEGDETSDDQPRYFGLYQREDGVTKERALKFVQPPLLQIRDSDETEMPPFFGTVKVNVFEAGPPNSFEEEEVSDSDQSDSCVYSLEVETVNVEKNKRDKHVRSAEGSIKSSKKYRRQGKKALFRTKTEHWPRGNLVEVISLHYCTAVGLIHVGVLPKPPNIYTFFHMETNNKKRYITMDDVPIVTPKRICKSSTFKAEDGKDMGGTEDKYIDMFDLTEMSSVEEADTKAA
jgi:hypothetical protein